MTAVWLWVSIAILISERTALFGNIPIASDGTLGALNVNSGTVVFNTDFTTTNGGTYSVNGVTQRGQARDMGLPQNSGGVDHTNANIFVFDFTDINLSSNVNVSVIGECGLVLLASGTAELDANFNLSGVSGQAGGVNAGGGGGAGGGVISVFANGDLTFAGVIRLNGGDGALSYQTAGNGWGGSGGGALAGGGSGGQGGFAEGGGRGGTGGDGAFVGFNKILSIGFYLDGGGGGGAYNGGAGGGGRTGGYNGDAGQGGSCPTGAIGGKGGSGHNLWGDNGGAAGGGNGGSGSPLGAGGGGGGGNAPNGTPGGAGGAAGLFCGAGGGGGGGDLCTTNSHPALDNGGGGGGGGSGGNPGSVIPTASEKSGGGGGGGQSFLGTDSGVLTYTGTIEAFGGNAPCGDGGSGSLKLIAPDEASLHVQAGALFNGVTPLSDSNSVFVTDLTLADYLPAGGGGGGGGGGSGLVNPCVGYPIISSISIVSTTNLVISGMNGCPEATCTVLSSTNITAPLTNWIVLVTNKFGTDGSFAFTNVIAPGVPGQFYRLQQSQP